MEAEKKAGTATLRPVGACDTTITMRMPNRPFKLPPFAVGEALGVEFTLVGIKEMTVHEDGDLVLRVRGFARPVSVEAENWLMTLPDWEVTQKKDPPAQ